MEIQLSAQVEAAIQARISSGVNKSVEEVITEAIGLLTKREDEYQEKLAWLRQAIDEGLEGEFTPFDLEEVIQLGEQMLERGEVD